MTASYVWTVRSQTGQSTHADSCSLLKDLSIRTEPQAMEEGDLGHIFIMWTVQGMGFVYLCSYPTAQWEEVKLAEAVRCFEQF